MYGQQYPMRMNSTLLTGLMAVVKVIPLRMSSGWLLKKSGTLRKDSTVGSDMPAMSSAVASGDEYGLTMTQQLKQVVAAKSKHERGATSTRYHHVVTGCDK